MKPNVPLRTASKLGSVALLVVLISVLHYATGLQNMRYHSFYRELYFLPLILAGLWFGLRGAVIVSVSIAVLYLPFIRIGWDSFSPTDFDRVLSILLFNLVAIVLGFVSSREKARQKALRESESLAAMGRAISGVAHDIKTPLTAIGGFTRRVQKTLSQEDPNREKLDVVINETKRLEAMVREMLDFSGPLSLNLQSTDPVGLLRASLAVIEDEALRCKVNLEISLGQDLPNVELDPVRMEQVLINLAMNALQVSAEGGTVVIAVCRRAGELILDIVDRGPGIPRGNKEKIFRPFFTTRKGGTGLGLPIVQKIVDAHGGTVRVLENPGGGVTFQVALPIDRRVIPFRRRVIFPNGQPQGA
jgi:two-component system sensor histidine kinase HydH